MLFDKKDGKPQEIDWAKALSDFEGSEAGRFLEGESIKFRFCKSAQGDEPVVLLDASPEFVASLPDCPVRIESSRSTLEIVNG